MATNVHLLQTRTWFYQQAAPPTGAPGHERYGFDVSTSGGWDTCTPFESWEQLAEFCDAIRAAVPQAERPDLLAAAAAFSVLGGEVESEAGACFLEHFQESERAAAIDAAQNFGQARGLC